MKTRFLARRPAVGILVLAAVLAPSTSAEGLTPKSPQIRAAVAKGQKYLLEHAEGGGGDEESRIGGQCLVALTLVKSGVPKDHKMVQAAVSTARAGISNGRIAAGYGGVYNTSLGVILLAMLKDTSYRGDIAAGLRLLLAKQKNHGGFDTGSASLGDTSMTQYAVLAMWEAAHAPGVEVPVAAWRGASSWLVRTQLPAGNYTYNPPAADGHASHSMAAAGVSSLYICANYAQPRGQKPETRKKDKPVPAVFQSTNKKKKRNQRPGGRAGFTVPGMDNALAKADRWFGANFVVKTEPWPLYYLYAVERYYSFREKWEGNSPQEPAWYNQGAAHLLEKQTADGSWPGSASPSISTSFAILFLIRSTKMGLQVADEAAGTLVSGQGLPPDLSQIKISGGKVVVKPLAGPAGELLNAMEDPAAPEFLRAVEGLRKLTITADDAMLSPHLVRLRKLAGSDSPRARAASIAALGRLGRLDDVPTLIYALRDDHPQVVLSARDALRFVSRKFEGLGLNDVTDNTQRSKGIEKWKAWYRSVRPGTALDE